MRPFLHLSIHLADLGGIPYMFKSPQAAASMVNLQACFIGPATVEHAPSDTGQFVGQRHHQDTRMRSFGSGFQPTAETVFVPVLRAYQDSPGPLDEERPEMLVAALGDAAQDGSVSRRHLPGNKAQPSAKVTAAPER